jgi:hypothetical protein
VRARKQLSTTMASTGSCSRVAQRQLSRSASARCAVRASRIRFTRHTRWVRNTGGGFVAYTRSLLRMFFMIVPSLSGQTTTIAVHKQAESKRLLLHCCSFLIQSSSAGAVRDRLQVLSRLQRRESDALRPRPGCEIRIFCAKFMLKMIVCQDRLGTSIGKALKKENTMGFSQESSSQCAGTIPGSGTRGWAAAAAGSTTARCLAISISARPPWTWTTACRQSFARRRALCV